MNDLGSIRRLLFENIRFFVKNSYCPSSFPWWNYSPKIPKLLWKNSQRSKRNKIEQKSSLNSWILCRSFALILIKESFIMQSWWVECTSRPLRYTYCDLTVSACYRYYRGKEFCPILVRRWTNLNRYFDQR